MYNIITRALMRNLCHIVLVRIKSQVLSILGGGGGLQYIKSMIIRRQGSLIVILVHVYHRPHEEEVAYDQVP